MKTEYKHIHFEKTGQKPKTSVWTCFTNRGKGRLGEVRWYGAWRQYCYFSEDLTVYSTGCLADIQGFLQQVNNKETPCPES